MDESREQQSREWNLKLALSVYGAILATVLTGCLLFLTATSHRRSRAAELRGIEQSTSSRAPSPGASWRFIVASIAPK